MQPTLLSLANPSEITKMQDKAMAMHKLRRTFALGLLIARQNIRETAIVTRTAIKEIEHPTIEIISRALR